MARVAGERQFRKVDLKRIYFGNRLRDYSRAVDTSTVKCVSAMAISLVLWVYVFMSFEYVDSTAAWVRRSHDESCGAGEFVI